MPVEEPDTCNPPDEWLGTWFAGGGFHDVVWDMQCELYGKRVAPKSRTTWLAMVLTDKLKLEQCIKAPWFFKSDQRKIQLEIHIDEAL